MGRAYSCWMLNRWYITWPVGFKRLKCFKKRLHFLKNTGHHVIITEKWGCSSSSLGPVTLCPRCTSALGLLCNPKYSNQYTFNNPLPLIKRHRSLTEAVLISFGPTNGFPKTLQRWRANASQQQIICCTVSVSFLQNLQWGCFFETVQWNDCTAWLSWSTRLISLTFKNRASYI